MLPNITGPIITYYYITYSHFERNEKRTKSVANNGGIDVETFRIDRHVNTDCHKKAKYLERTCTTIKTGITNLNVQNRHATINLFHKY